MREIALNQDYETSVRVKASPEALVEAVTSLSGIAAWWTDVNGSAGAGGELRLWFGPPEPLVLQVDAASRPGTVQWAVTACGFLPEWVGTRPTFTITPIGDVVCDLHFRHYGLTAELDCIEMCTRGWNHFIPSLRQYAETGQGNPLGSPADQARRAHENDAQTK
jgi:uncharacterized protein YndB with AHSA1/START domain